MQNHVVRLKGMVVLATIVVGGAFLSASAQVVQAWVSAFNGPGYGPDSAFAITLDGESNVYIAGTTMGTGASLDYVTIKFNSNGLMQWTATYNGPLSGADVALAVAVDGAGNVYVTGKSIGVYPNYDFATVKYDVNGVQQWVTRYSSAGDGEANSIAVDASGNVYVSGWTYAGSYNHTNYVTIKYNPTGTPLWSSIFSNPGESWDYARAMKVDQSGNVYVTGSGWRGIYSWDYATVKYDSSGAQQWVAYYNGSGSAADNAYDLAVDDFGNVYVTGQSWGTMWTLNDCATVKYNSAGVEQWVARYSSPADFADGAYCLALDSAGSVYIAGYCWNLYNAQDYVTVKYNSAGIEQWVQTYAGLTYAIDIADEIAVDAAGNAFVTGRSGGDVAGSAGDYATIKYNTNGIMQWVMRFDGAANANDAAHAMALDNSGSVYVTGYSNGGATQADIVTLKYSPPPASVSIAMNPVGLIEIPAAGGSFDFVITLTNTGLSSATKDVWTMAQLPSGAWYGPALGPVSVTLPAGATLSRQRTQTVPGSAPAGLYTYSGNVGVYPTANDSSSFEFTKLPVGRGASVQYWENTGEDFVAQDIGGADKPPAGFIVSQVYPNPFNPRTAIKFDLPISGWSTLEIFDLSGSSKTTLVSGWREAGSQEVIIDGSGWASGIYVYRLQVGAYAASGKLVLMK